MFRDPVASLYVEPRQVYLGDGVRQSGNWGPLHAEFPIDYKAMIDAFKNLSTSPKIYLMVPPPLYQDGRYGALCPTWREGWCKLNH